MADRVVVPPARRRNDRYIFTGTHLVRRPQDAAGTELTARRFAFAQPISSIKCAMKWTKERKIYGGLLALGLVALVIDRCSGGPKEAAAQQEDAAALVAPNVAGKTAPSKNARTSEGAILARSDISLAERLRAATNGQLVSDKSVVDVFRPSRKWAGDAGGSEAHVLSDAERFRAAHRLTAVMMSGRSSRAIVDGTPLRLGESLDGFKLLSVDPAKAVLGRNGASVALALEQTPISHTGR